MKESETKKTTNKKGEKCTTCAACFVKVRLKAKLFDWIKLLALSILGRIQ